MASLSTFARCVCRLVPLTVRSGISQTTTQQVRPLFSRIITRGISSEIDPDDPRTVPNSEWEKKLTPEQYAVCREKNTEAPFSGKYVNHYEKGIYHCICCDAELFSSDAKFDSSSGWPSFSEAHGTKDNDERYSNVLRRHDNSCGMVRTEVICKKCDSHLGHVFSDGPKPTGQRFCINSLSLKFKSYRPH